MTSKSSPPSPTIPTTPFRETRPYCDVTALALPDLEEHVGGVDAENLGHDVQHVVESLLCAGRIDPGGGAYSATWTQREPASGPAPE